MAFTRKTFDPLPSTKGLANQAMYETLTDNTATVEGAGYFNEVADNLRANFVITVVSSDQTNIYAGTSIAGVVALNVTLNARID